jgi:CubicO group peptidase (beta-lactamase class C family)
MFEILGEVDHHRLYCTASFSKMMTTFVCLSHFAEKYDLNAILDDDDFLSRVCVNLRAREFLAIFENAIGGKFSLRDVCTYYNGLPYTFDLAQDELNQVEQGNPLKHHHIMDEAVFLDRCRHLITQMDPNRCKFHYSELAIIFLGYVTEQIDSVRMEDLYHKHVINAFGLTESMFSRVRPAHVHIEDFSKEYDYPSIAITDHGYFCYSNGFFTTLHDQKKLLEHMLETSVFKHMTNLEKARAASRTLMNGLTIEIRMVQDDVLYGYEGLSYSGCNIWAYSTKHKKGYLTSINSEEKAYDVIYGKFGYDKFDAVPQHTEKLYHEFLETHHYEYELKPIPSDYVGEYLRVNINDSALELIFTVAEHHIIIRNPEMVKYDVLYDHGIYRISCKDHMHGVKVGFYQAESGHHYMCFDGTLYRKIV